MSFKKYLTKVSLVDVSCMGQLSFMISDHGRPQKCDTEVKFLYVNDGQVILDILWY